MFIGNVDKSYAIHGSYRILWERGDLGIGLYNWLKKKRDEQNEPGMIIVS